MLEIIGLVLGLALVAALALWNFYKGEKAGKNKADLRNVEKTIETAVKDKARANDTPVAGASERLRNSRWNRDRQPVSGGQSNNGE